MADRGYDEPAVPDNVVLPVLDKGSRLDILEGLALD